MKVITGNRLSDGVVVYLGRFGQWTALIQEAEQYTKEASLEALAGAQARAGEIADVYLIEVGEDGLPAGREALRETIRTAGPTVRTDLGYQAGA